MKDFPITYLITGGEATIENFDEKKREILALVEHAVETNISLIQIREKKLTARLCFDLASEVTRIAKNSATKILINDRADIALAAGADGVHLTAHSLTVGTIRRALGDKKFIVGTSAHTIAEATAAKRGGADFITFSPIFASPGKGAPLGADTLREVCEHLKPFPVVALGGIDETNFRSVLQAGASGFAAIRFFEKLLNDANSEKSNFF